MKVILAIAALTIAYIVGMALPSFDKSYVQSVNSKEALQRPIGSISFKRSEIISALTQALQIARLPGGVVRVEDLNSLDQERFMAGPGLGDLLQKITTVTPTYQWNIEDGVVNLVPVAGEPVLLNLQLKEFNVGNAKTLNEATIQLLAKPEVQKQIADLKLNTGLSVKVGPVQSSKIKPPKMTPINIESKNITVRQALNAIVRSHGRAVWEYKETHWKDHHGFSIEFLVQ